MDQNDIMVSICCSVYNHEKYLRQCLDGFMMQKTNFKFEVLIHDDASTDNSQNIIREYEEKYPEIIKPIYQTENQYSKRKPIVWRLQYPRAKGKYIAICEGDDFWTDELKLQKQFDALEQNESCVFCTHVVRCVKENGNSTKRVFPQINIEKPLIKSDALVHLITSINYLFQTSSYFLKTEIVQKYVNQIPEFMKGAKAGDTPLMLLLATEGDCFFINEEMSCYRINSLGSWSERHKNIENKIKFWEAQKRMIQGYDKFTDYKYSQQINESVLKTETILCLLNKKFGVLFKRKCLKIFLKLSLKEKISYTVFVIFPKLRPICEKIKNKLL